MRHIENLLIGLIGKPLLWVIKWLRWPLLFYGALFNAVYTYDPKTKVIALEKVTYIPFIIGLVLFSIGLTVKRYDECVREYMKGLRYEEWLKEHEKLLEKTDKTL